MSILRPWTQEVLARWHPSVVLKDLMKPPFAINGSDKNISLELLSHKTVFLVALATGACGSELVALPRAPHNLEFKTLDSGAKQVPIRMVPKLIPKNQRPELIPKPLVFPGIAHLFPKDLEWLLCPVRVLDPNMIRSVDRAKEDPHQKPFVHFFPGTQLFTTHFRRWVAESIRLTYETSSWVGSSQDSSTRCQSGGCLHSLLQENSSIRAMWTDQMEVLQCFRPTLPEGHGSRHRTSGPSPGGHTYSLTLKTMSIYSSLTTSTNVI